MPTARPNQPLPYAAPKSGLRHPRRLILIASFLAASLATWQLAPPTYRGLSQLHWQRRCLRFTFPAAHIAYREQLVHPTKLPVAAPASDSTATLLAELNAQHPGIRVTTTPPPELSRFYAFQAVPTDPLIFLHARRTPAGHTRLVIVTAASREGSPSPSVFFSPGGSFLNATVFTPTYSPPLRFSFQRRATSHDDDRLLRVELANLLLHPGQPDPNDDTHFTIDYQAYSTPGTIDAYLHDDDSITFHFRDPIPPDPHQPKPAD
jgi:hypothetical protein